MKFTGLVVISVAGTVALTSAASADPNNTATDINQGAIDLYSGDSPVPNDDISNRTPSKDGKVTLGDAIQAGFYGNAANPRPSGNGTLPSLSPGPQVNNGGGPGTGTSWGEIKRDLNPSNF